MPTSASTPPQRRTVQDPEALLEDLAKGDESPRQIAQRHNMTLAQLTRWASRATTIDRVAQVRRLADERATLAVAAARVAAAHALHRLALSTEHPETARRACVDLLKLDPRTIPDDDAPEPNASTDIAAESRDAIRALLERLEARDQETTTP